MNNRYVSVKCPSCGSTIQVKVKSIWSDVFYCPVCETGEIENPRTSLIIECHKVRMPAAQPVLVPA